MYNIVDTYKRIYKLKSVKSKIVNDNSINFIFFDNFGNFYSVKNKLVEYSSSLSLCLVSIILNIEKIYKVKIYNFFPVCFVNNNSMLFACKIKYPSNCLTKYKKDNTDINEFSDLIKKQIKYYSDDYDDERLLLERYSNRYRVYQNFMIMLIHMIVFQLLTLQVEFVIFLEIMNIKVYVISFHVNHVIKSQT